MLLADPDDIQRRCLATLLRFWGMRIHEAETLQQAQQIVLNHTVDLLLLAEDLSDEPPLQTISRLRRCQAGTLPALLLCAQVRPGLSDSKQSIGCISKPVSLSGLLENCLSLLSMQFSSPPLAISDAQQLPLRILLAEDHPINQRLAVRLLTRLGHTVQLAGNGQEAVRLQQQEDFDLVLMDVQMPVMGGLEAAGRIRQLDMDRGRRHQPMLAMTAHAMQGDMERCLAAGLDGYVSKPIAQERLLSEMARVLGRPVPPPQARAGLPTEARQAFNLQEALSNFAQDEGMMLEMVELLFELAERDEHTLKQAVAGGDCREVAQLAHRIAGSIAIFGGHAAVYSARVLESLALQLEAGKLQHACDRFVLDMRQLLVVLQQWQQSVATSGQAFPVTGGARP